MGVIYQVYDGDDPHEISKAMADIIEERHRQVDDEGWDTDHDDKHTNGDLAAAAACYSIWDVALKFNDRDRIRRNVWPWNWSWWKPKDRRANLVRAGALIAAEIERIDRLQQ